MAEGRFLDAVSKAGAATELLRLSHDRGGALAASDWLSELIVDAIQGLSREVSIGPDGSNKKPG
jgi:hypothetical protein